MNLRNTKIGRTGIQSYLWTSCVFMQPKRVKVMSHIYLWKTTNSEIFVFYFTLILYFSAMKFYSESCIIQIHYLEILVSNMYRCKALLSVYCAYYCLHCTHRHQWFCHLDDDVYIIVKQLSNMLQKYHHNEPYYVGGWPQVPGLKKATKITNAQKIHPQFLACTGAKP